MATTHYNLFVETFEGFWQMAYLAKVLARGVFSLFCRILKNVPKKPKLTATSGGSELLRNLCLPMVQTFASSGQPVEGFPQAEGNSFIIKELARFRKRTDAFIKPVALHSATAFMCVKSLTNIKETFPECPGKSAPRGADIRSFFQPGRMITHSSLESVLTTSLPQDMRLNPGTAVPCLRGDHGRSQSC